MIMWDLCQKSKAGFITHSKMICHVNRVKVIYYFIVNRKFLLHTVLSSLILFHTDFSHLSS